MKSSIIRTLATITLLLPLTVFATEPKTEHWYRIVVDGRAVGGIHESVSVDSDRLVFDEVAQHLWPSPGGDGVHRSRTRAIEHPDGRLARLEYESGTSGQPNTIVVHRREDGWVRDIRNSYGSFSRELDVQGKLLGPLGERKLVHRSLARVGDQVQYQLFDRNEGIVARVTAELTAVRSDGTRIVVKSGHSRALSSIHHYDAGGEIVQVQTDVPMLGRMVAKVEAREPVEALMAEAEPAATDAGPGILETDTGFVEGSGIRIEALSDSRIRNLALLGRVWGYLKYHHPRVTAGDLHWDFELFRILPELLAATGVDAGRDVLVEWLDKLGEPPACEPCAALPEEMRMAPTLAWLNDQDMLGIELSARLQRIHQRRPADAGQYFVNLSAGAGIPDFSREPAFKEIDPADSGYRLLTLFRWWNIIEYWFPYRGMIDEGIDGDWHDVLEEFIPRLVEAGSHDEYRLELLALGARIGDGHVSVMGAWDVLPPTGQCFWPLAVRFIEQQLMVVAARDPEDIAVHTGDVIHSIDGVPVEQIVKDRAPYYSASNETARRHLIAQFMFRGACGEVALAIDRDGERKNVVVERTSTPPPGHAHDHPGETVRMLSDRVAYMTLSSFQSAKVDEYLAQIDGIDALVIDIRNYPSESAVFSLGQRLVRKTTEFARFTRAGTRAPGAFFWTRPMTLKPREPGFSGRVAILVDESTVSHAEYTAMALRTAPGAIVVGSRTRGANGNVARFPLPGGLSVAMSSIGAYYADKTPMQRVGIIADVPAQPSIEGFRAGRDEVLETALAELLGPEASSAKIRETARFRPD